MKIGKNKGWCEDQDKIVSQLVLKYGTKNWALISQELHEIYGYRKKTGKQCRQRYYNHLDPNVTKDSWTRSQEDLLFNEHRIHGNKWTLIAEKLPGRTDNSIKNHFYSTIRKSLRRISKFMGSKDSTIQMRQIKPATLSQILNLALGSQDQKNKTKEQQSYKQIAHYLMDFGRNKLRDIEYVLTQQDNRAFQKILQQMCKLNQIHLHQKIMQARLRKEKLLQKNFDEVSQSESDQEQYFQNFRPISQKYKKKQNTKDQDYEIITTRKNKKTKKTNTQQQPNHQTSQRQQRQRRKGKNKQKQQQINEQIKQIVKEQIKQQENKQSCAKYLINSPIYRDLTKIQEEAQIQQEPNIINQNMDLSDKFQFFLEIIQQQQRQKDIYQLSISPKIRNTPMALTPKTYEFMRQLQQQPLKNQQCNLAYNKIIHDIKRNTHCQCQVIEKHIYFPSPSSVFRQNC